MRWGGWLAWGLGFALGGAIGCSQAEAPPAERIVLVSIDTTRADHVGCYGDTHAATPTLDGLAAEGVRFDAAFSPAPLTLPSHSTLLTGLDPPEHGVRANGRFTLPPEIPTLAEALHGEGFATAAFVAAFVLDARFGLARGFDVYDDAVQDPAAGPLSPPERSGDQVVDAALAWVRKAPDRFFLWVHLYDPHAEYHPPRRWLKAAGGDPYRGEIAFADFQVNRLIGGVVRRFGRAGLLVAVTADHGESLGEHGEKTHSYSLYDATQRIPLILYGAGIPKARVVRAPVRLKDVAPTLLARAGSARLAGATGRDLLPLALGAKEEPRVAYMETLATQIDMSWSPLLGLRTATHAYIRAPRRELYDLARDPGEEVNLAAAQPALADALDHQLEEHLAHARPVTLDTALDADGRAQLEALGYLMPETPAGPLKALGVVGGPDPKDHLDEATAINQAASFLTRGQGQDALDALARVKTRGQRYYAYQVRAANAAGRPELALEAAQALIEGGGVNTEALWLRGSAELQLGRVDAARADFEAAASLSSDSALPSIGLGRIAVREGRLDDAAALFERAAGLRDRGLATLELAAVRARQGRDEEARKLLVALPAPSLRALLKSASHQPDVRALLSTRAAALYAAGRADDALRAWRDIYAVAPHDPAARNDLAFGLASSGVQLERALRLARSAAKSLGDTPAVLDTLATVHLARGEPEPALKVADRGLAAATPALRPHLLLLRAEALASLSRRDEARATLQRLAAEPADLDPRGRERAEALSRKLGPG